MRTLVVALVAALVSSPAWAKKHDPENWANKNGIAGVGAGITLNGFSGAQLRYFATKDFGLLLTLSADMNSGSIDPDGGDSVDIKDSEIDFGLYGEYKIIKNKKGSLAGVLGVDMTSYSWDYGSDDDSYSNLQIGLGLKGEAFLTQRFSVYSHLGLVFDPWGEAELQEMGLNPKDYDISGNSITLGGGLMGSAGFTYWFG